MNFKGMYLKIMRGDKKDFFMACFVTSMSYAILYTFIAVVNDEVIKSVLRKDNGFIPLLYGIIISLVLFAIFIMSYAFSKMLKNRSREIGIIISLGFSKKKIAELLNFEIIYCFMISVVLGICIGVILSNTVINMITYIVFHIQKVRIFFYGNVFMLITILFIIILFIIVLVNFINLTKKSIHNILDTSYNLRNPNVNDIFMFFGGIVLIALSLFILNMAIKNGYNIIPVYLIAILGIYLFEYSLGTILIRLVKNNDLIFLSNLRSKYNNYSKLIISLTILVIFSIFFVGICYLNYNIEEETILEDKPYDITIDCDLNNNISLQNIYSNLNLTNNMVNSQSIIVYADGKVKYFLDEDDIDIISLDTFNKLTGSDLELLEGDCHIVTQLNRNQSEEWMPNGQEINISIGNQIFNLRIVGESWNFIYNTSERFKRIIVFNNQDFNEIQNDLLIQKYLINLIDWHMSKDLSNNADTILLFKNIYSKYDQYKQELDESTITLIFIIFTAVIFLVSLGSILYFKISNDTEEVYNDSKNLIALGLSKTKVFNIVCKNYSLFYIMPTLIGIIYGNIFIFMQLNKVFYEIFILDVVYIIAQFIYYYLSMRRLKIKCNL